MRRAAAARRAVAASRAAVLALGVSILAGCPLSSDKPLSDPSTAAPDPSIVGTWQARDPETGEVSHLEIRVFNGHEMVAMGHGSDASDTGMMRLFQTRIGTETFLNIQELGKGGSESGDWFFARYRVEGDRLRMTIVDDGLFKDRVFSSSEELRAFVARSLADPRLYAASDDTPTEMLWERVAEPASGSGSKS